MKGEQPGMEERKWIKSLDKMRNNEDERLKLWTETLKTPKV